MIESAVTAPPFVETKEYRRFAEFCDACRRYRYVGLCYGPPGVGKTLSARHYARWDQLEPVVRNAWAPPQSPVRPELIERRTLFYIVSMTTTPKRLEQDLSRLCNGFKLLVGAVLSPEKDQIERAVDQLTGPQMAGLLVVDEVDRLKFPVLEQLRHQYDQGGFGLILIGMPGLQKRLARYPQLYSRVGFVHEFRSLSADELRFLLEQKWQQLGLTIDLTDFDDVEALTAIIRITGGNFRLLQWLFAQIERILQVNQLHAVTKEVVETARESLVIGQI